jgi:hypothetical protein
MSYKPQPGDHMLNHLVRFCDGPFSHSEISFEDGMACSVFNGEQVFLEHRTYKNPNYVPVTLLLKQEQYTKVREFCARNARDGVGFDQFGMFASILPVHVSVARKDRTFCSRLVTEALQHGGVACVQHLDPARTTPSGLHAVLAAASPGVIDTVPARCQRLDYTPASAQKK